MKIKRYDHVPEDSNIFVETVERENGCWVRYEDIKQMLQEIFPTLDDTKHHVWFVSNAKTECQFVEESYFFIKSKLQFLDK